MRHLSSGKWVTIDCVRANYEALAKILVLHQIGVPLSRHQNQGVPTKYFYTAGIEELLDKQKTAYPALEARSGKENLSQCWRIIQSIVA